MKPYVIAVRALCEFTAKAGDLDLRFTPAPTALEGQAGHAVVASRRRRDGYESELSLSGTHGVLTVRGRADGWDERTGTLEEVKTYRGDLARQPANHRVLHRAQALVYGWLMCEKLGLPELKVSLVYFDIGSQRETVFTELHAAEALREHFQLQCERFIAWAGQELAHRGRRDEALAALQFPHPAFRTGQRELAEAVYRGALKGRCLMAQAPTGIGKTVGTLFPLLKAMPGQQLDKVFFLTAKGPGRRLALDAAQALEGASVRVLELVARDKACEHPDKACHGESCPLARGFYDRLPAARAQALTVPLLDQAAVREAALAHQVCPYYLSQELARWADVVVGDYNYFFDLGGALLQGLTQAQGWKVGLLVDEAHNLLERARLMYTADLSQADFKAARKGAPAALKRPLTRLDKAWNTLARSQETDYQVHPEVPDEFRDALQKATTALTDHFTEHPTEADPTLQRFYFDALHFSRVLELFDTHSLFDVTLADLGQGRRRHAVLTLRNVVPAPLFAPRLATAHSATLFSATLAPRHFHADLLGLPEDTAWVDVPTPFTPDQLEVKLARHISTRYQHREASLAPIARLMSQQYAERPGNYLAFFSSFDYLQQVMALFGRQSPEVPVWAQSRGMAEAERAAFLQRFAADGRGIGFAVLGGAFGEGIDLPGSRLIGAFIATLGLPQFNPVNQEMKQRLAERFGEDQGYDYAYLYPGLQKVVQAAGRVIRTTTDQGVIHLIDDRFGEARVRRLLPSWWRIAKPIGGSERQISANSAV